MQQPDDNVIFLTPPHSPSVKRPWLVATTTDEPAMPVRLYYNVKARKIVGHFCSMLCTKRCEGYYLFLYQDIMETLDLTIPATEVAPDYPAIIARALVDYKANRMIIDVDSYLRAIKLVEFIGNNIPKAAGELEFVATYNRFSYVKQGSSVKFMDFSNYNHLFGSQTYPEGPAINIYNISKRQAKQQLLNQYPLTTLHLAATTKDGLDELDKILGYQIAVAAAISDGINCSIWNFRESFAKNNKKSQDIL